MNESTSIFSGTRPITPLVVIGLFVLLTNAVATVALIQTQGAVQTALTGFVIVFPTIIVALFFATLWRRPQVLYSPKEYESISVIEYVQAMQGHVPTLLETPGSDDTVTEEHMDLLHSSWRYAKVDERFQGRAMYAFHVVIKARESVLNRIEFVKYQLPPPWTNPERTVTDRESNFKLKELAWGEFKLNAEVKIKGQHNLIKLSRYINLTMTGPRI
jgi:hypothetical protein